MAAPFILDQASVSLRPPKGYYGNFGENDNEYVDQLDFSSENRNKNATDISIDDDKMSLGDTTLCNNINKQIEFLNEDDIELDQFEKMPQIRTPKTRCKPKGRGRGRGRRTTVPKGAGCGRGHGTQMPKEENEVGGKNLTHNKMDNKNEPGKDGISIKQHDEQTHDTTEYFNNGTFFNTELSHAGGSSLSIEVIAEVHKENASRMDEGNMNESRMDEGTSDNAIILHYNDNLYFVNPPPKPQQPVLLINEGGTLNGVFLNNKGTSGKVIYEVVDSHNESRPNPNELFKHIMSSDSDDPATKSADELRTWEKGMVLTKQQGHQTDSKLERLQVITYNDEPPKKMNATSTEMKPQQSVTKAEQSVKRVDQSVTKVDQSVTKAEQSATEIDENASMKLYYCSMCTATFWTDGGLHHHESLHFRKSPFDPDYHRQELQGGEQMEKDKDKDITEDRNEATNDESTQPNEKDSKDLTNGEKTEDDKPKQEDKKDITDDEAHKKENTDRKIDSNEQKELTQDTDSQLHVSNEVNEKQPKQHEVTDNEPKEAKEGDITEQDNELKNNEKENENAENEDKPRQHEVTQQDNESTQPNEKDSKVLSNGVKKEEGMEKTDNQPNEAKDDEVPEQDNEIKDNEKEKDRQPTK